MPLRALPLCTAWLSGSEVITTEDKRSLIPLENREKTLTLDGMCKAVLLNQMRKDHNITQGFVPLWK